MILIDVMALLYQQENLENRNVHKLVIGFFSMELLHFNTEWLLY